MKALDVVRPNKILQAIAAGRRCPGFQMAFYSPTLIEVLGSLDFEFVYLDCEHGVFSLSDIENCCRAAEVSGLTVISRVPHIGPIIGEFLDRGVQGFVVPHVSSKADVERIMEYAFFAPLGHRSNAGGRGDRFWYPVLDYETHFQEVNKSISICIQIEDREAVENLDDILSCKRVDYYVVGKNDLAQSMGVVRQKNASLKSLVEIVDEISGEIRKNGGLMAEDAIRLLYMREHLLTSGQHFLNSDAVDSYKLEF